MTDSVAVTGEVTGYSSTADGGLRIKIELDELQAAKFTEGFRVHALVVIARMNDQPETDGPGP